MVTTWMVRTQRASKEPRGEGRGREVWRKYRSNTRNTGEWDV